MPESSLGEFTFSHLLCECDAQELFHTSETLDGPLQFAAANICAVWIFSLHDAVNFLTDANI